MRNTLSLVVLCFVLSSTFLHSQNTATHSILFDTDSYKLSKSNLDQVNNLIADIQDFSDYKFNLKGHTDLHGTNEYNLALSKRRVLSVHEFLVKNGVNQNAIELSWHGEEQLLENYAEGQNKNRRVEISLVGYNFENVDELFYSLKEDQMQYYECNNTQDKTIETQEGAIIYVPSHSFAYENGQAINDEQIEIQIKEAYNYTDFILEDLYTESKDQILESGGMIYIQAYANGKKLKIKDDKRLEITYPLQEVKEDMQLFYSSTDETGRINWENSEQNFETKVKKQIEDIDVDWEVLFAYEMMKLEKPTLKFPKLKPRPRVVEKPYPPAKPTPLNANSENLKKYNISFEKYQNKLALYEQNKDSDKKLMEKWQKEVSKRIEDIRQYKRNMCNFHVYVQTKGAIMKIENEVGKRSNNELLKYLKNHLSATVNLSFNDREFYLEAFENQTRQILKEREIYPKLEAYTKLQNKDFYPDINNLMNQAMVYKSEKTFAKTGKIGEENFKHYVTNINKLGWINCDRYKNYPDYLLADIKLNEAKDDTKYYLIFKKFKSMLSGKRSDSGMAFKNIPRNEEIRLVAIRLIDNKPQLAISDYVVQKENNLDLEFQESTLLEIKEALNTIDSFVGS